LCQEIAINPKTDVTLGANVAMLCRRNLWVKAELVRLEDAPCYVDDRLHSLGLQKAAEAGLSAGADLRGRLRQQSAGSPAATPQVQGAGG
jgi:hypothetical protein